LQLSTFHQGDTGKYLKKKFTVGLKKDGTAYLVLGHQETGGLKKMARCVKMWSHFNSENQYC